MKILLLHLNAAERAALAESVRDDGHHVVAVSETCPKDFAPHILVVCLDAHPQRTLDVAAHLGADAGVQAASMLFVGGTPSALQEAQRRFPKASFARLDALSTALASMDS